MPEQLVLESVEETAAGILVRVRAKGNPQCPTCFGSQVSHHSEYERSVLDLPWQGRQVHLRIRTRRFRCRNADCQRKVFAERLAGVAVPWARESVRLGEVVGVVGYALGGLPGARLLKRLGMGRGPDTVLRRVKARQCDGSPASVRVLGVDDWAWRKHQSYGTMLMDLEQRRVIDLLPDRSADSFARWLDNHPEVAVITRDRSGLYADGARQGAPGAVQITDRYHLVSNLSEAVERDVQQLQIKARAELAERAAGDDRRPKKLTRIEARRQRCRQARYERYLAVVELRCQGLTQVAIAEKVGIAAYTVARWLASPGFPERRIRSNRRRDRALFLQAQERGVHPSLTRVHYSAGRVAALLVKPPRTLSEAQQRYLGAFLRFCPEAHQLRRFVMQFRAMLRWRSGRKLSHWMEAAMASRFPFLAQFAKALRRDLDAVKLAMTTPWNNGPLEGHINRLKVIKRQMYGRAGFELLKARVLPWKASHPACTEIA